MSRSSSENGGYHLTVVISTLTLALLSSASSGLAAPHAAAWRCLELLRRVVEANRSDLISLDVAFFETSHDYLQVNASLFPNLENVLAELARFSGLPLDESLQAVFQLTEQVEGAQENIDWIDFKQLRQLNRYGTKFVLLDAVPSAAQARAMGICPSHWIISHQQLEQLLTGDRRAIAGLLSQETKASPKEVSEGEGSVAKTSQQDEIKHALDQLLFQRLMSSTDLIQGWALAVAVIATILISLRVSQEEDEILKLRIAVPDLPPVVMLQGLQLASQHSAERLDALAKTGGFEFERLGESAGFAQEQTSAKDANVDGLEPELEVDFDSLPAFSTFLTAVAQAADVNQAMDALRQVVDVPVEQAAAAQEAFAEMEAFLLSPLGGAIASLLPARPDASDSDASDAATSSSDRVAETEAVARSARQPSASPMRTRQLLPPQRETATISGAHEPLVAARLIPALVDGWTPLTGLASGASFRVSAAIAPTLRPWQLNLGEPFELVSADIAVPSRFAGSSNVGGGSPEPWFALPGGSSSAPPNFVENLLAIAPTSKGESQAQLQSVSEESATDQPISGNSEPRNSVINTSVPDSSEPETPIIRDRSEDPFIDQSTVEEPVADESMPNELATGQPATDESTLDDSRTEQPAIEELANGEPASEDSVSEELTVQEPATQEPATEEPAAETPVTEQPDTENPNTEEPATEEPVAETPAIEEPATEDPAVEPPEPASQEPVSEPALENPVAETPDPTTIEAGGGRHVVEIPETSSAPWIIYNFGGIGTGTQPAESRVAEADTLQFVGSNLIAENLRLTQVGSDLKITFDRAPQVEVWLADFALENLDNLTRATTASVDFANLMFNGQTGIFDSIDVFNADWQRARVLNPNTVTFLNDLDNQTAGFENSDDIIHGQEGNDRLTGLSGNDRLLGGDGDDSLLGGSGRNQLEGGKGRDRFYLDANGYSLIDDLNLTEDRVYLPMGIGLDEISIVTTTVGSGVGSASQSLTEIVDQGSAIAGFNGTFTAQQIFDVLSVL